MTHNLNRDVDEAKGWIMEKDEILSTEDVGKDLRGVQGLQRKHEGLERDLAALENKISQLGENAKKLKENHPESTEVITTKLEEIHMEWRAIQVKVRERKEALLDSYDFQRFMTDYRDIECWIEQVKTLINEGELATDVPGAEALIDRHQGRDSMHTRKSLVTVNKIRRKVTRLQQHFS